MLFSTRFLHHPRLQLISIWGIFEGVYSNILLISCTSSNLCPPASTSIGSFCLNQPLLQCLQNVYSLFSAFHSWNFIRKRLSLLFTYSFIYLYLYGLWIPILLLVAICYYHYFYVQVCSRIGQWEPLGAGSCALVTWHHYSLSIYVLPDTKRHSRLILYFICLCPRIIHFSKSFDSCPPLPPEENGI